MALTETWLQKVIDEKVDGVELVMVEQVGGGRQRVVRLYVDHAEGVTHELCSTVSELVGKALEEADAVRGPYTLEVSSPGLERPLAKREHFEAQVGKQIYVKTRVAVEGGKVWRGRLVEVSPETVTIEQDGRQVRLRLVDISKAHLIYEFE